MDKVKAFITSPITLLFLAIYNISFFVVAVFLDKVHPGSFLSLIVGVLCVWSTVEEIENRVTSKTNLDLQP